MKSLRLFVSVFALFLATCGGGSGQGGEEQNVERLDGEYWSVGIGAVSPLEGYGMNGTMVRAGQDGLLFSWSRNDNGLVGSEQASASFELLPDRSWTVTGDLATPTGRGGFDPTGTLGVLASDDPARGPQMHLAMPQAGGPPLVDGETYHHVMFEHLNSTGIDARTVVSRALFVGSTYFLDDGIVNFDGAVSTRGRQDYDYVTADFGYFAADLGGDFRQGAFDPSASIGFAAGGSNAGSNRSIEIFIRTSTNVSRSSFQGRYRLVGFGLVSDEFNSFTGTLVADGLGNGTLEVTGATHLDVSSTVFDLTYDADSEGTLSMALGGIAQFQGGISADGSVAAVAAVANAGSIMFILVRE